MAGSTMRPLTPMRSASRAYAAAPAVVNSDTPVMRGTWPRTVFNGACQDGAFFLGAERVIFAHCSQENEAVNAVAHQRRLHGRGRREVNMSGGIKLSGGGGKHTGPWAPQRYGHEILPLIAVVDGPIDRIR